MAVCSTLIRKAADPCSHDVAVCSAVMCNGGASAAGWLLQLEGETGVAPLWEVLFQLAAHPVPQVSPQIVQSFQIQCMLQSLLQPSKAQVLKVSLPGTSLLTVPHIHHSLVLSSLSPLLDPTSQSPQHSVLSDYNISA